MKKTSRELERIVRGFSNHRRIQILERLDSHPELSVAEVATQLKAHFKTIAAHLERLAIAGLVMKRNDVTAVRHKLTVRGQSILKFLRTLA
jgi:predicted ArsR family transcriptional regulator